MFLEAFAARKARELMKNRLHTEQIKDVTCTGILSGVQHLIRCINSFETDMF